MDMNGARDTYVRGWRRVYTRIQHLPPSILHKIRTKSVYTHKNLNSSIMYLRSKLKTLFTVSNVLQPYN